MDQPTGRELDAEIARRVFGLEVEPHVNSITGKTDYVHRTASGLGWVPVAYYAERMGASLEVEYELRKRGWTRVDTPLRVGSQWNEPSDPTVILEHIDGRPVEAVGPVNEAICRAALKIMGA